MFYGPTMPGGMPGGPDIAARSKAERVSNQLELTRHDIERLLMITQALWEILKEQHGYGDEELFRRVSEIDLRDGHLDGRVAATQSPVCPNCGRRVGKHRPICLYCGKPIMVDPFQR